MSRDPKNLSWLEGKTQTGVFPFATDKTEVIEVSKTIQSYELELSEKKDPTVTLEFGSEPINQDLKDDLDQIEIEEDEKEEAPLEDAIPQVEDPYEPIQGLEEFNEEAFGAKGTEIHTQGLSKATLNLDSAPEEATGTAQFNYDAAQNFRLYVIEGNFSEKEYLVQQVPFRMGRDDGNELKIVDHNTSRYHAEIVEKNGVFFILDLGSTNGVKVNGALVTEKELGAHDLIQVGDALFEFLPPGVEARGEAPAVHATKSSEGKTKRSSKKLVKFALVLSLLGGLLYFYQRWNHTGITNALVEKVAKATTDEVKSSIEEKFQKPLSEISEDEIKKEVMTKLDHLPAVPEGVKRSLSQLPASLVKWMMGDKELIATLAKSSTQPNALSSILKKKLSERLKEQDYKVALSITDVLLQLKPEDKELKEIKSKVETILNRKSTKTPILPKGDLTTDERNQFFQYMDSHRTQFDKMMETKDFAKAFQFAELAKSKIEELVKSDAAFLEISRPHVEFWKSQIPDLKEKVEAIKVKKQAAQQKQKEGEDLIAQIQLNMDLGQVGEAFKNISIFLKKYPNHPDTQKVVTWKATMSEAVEGSFEAVKGNIERLIKTESFAAAWEELYRFVDTVSSYEPATALRANLEEATTLQAAQYYNQGRVFEYEAADMIAAEQYYKRAMETGDPRGELFKKAKRRHGEVKRKQLK